MDSHCRMGDRAWAPLVWMKTFGSCPSRHCEEWTLRSSQVALKPAAGGARPPASVPAAPQRCPARHTCPGRGPLSQPPPIQGPGGASLLRSHLGAPRSPPGGLSRGPRVVTPPGQRLSEPALARARPRRGGAVPGCRPCVLATAVWPAARGGGEGAVLLALRAAVLWVKSAVRPASQNWLQPPRSAQWGGGRGQPLGAAAAPHLPSDVTFLKWPQMHSPRRSPVNR